jgi:hypothetical protein
MRADPGLVGVDDEIERLRVHIALLGEDSLERSPPQLHLAEFRAEIVFVMGIVLVQVHHGSLVVRL